MCNITVDLSKVVWSKNTQVESPVNLPDKSRIVPEQTFNHTGICSCRLVCEAPGSNTPRGSENSGHSEIQPDRLNPLCTILHTVLMVYAFAHVCIPFCVRFGRSQGTILHHCMILRTLLRTILVPYDFAYYFLRTLFAYSFCIRFELPDISADDLELFRSHLITFFSSKT